jgi:hypothetical protein
MRHWFAIGCLALCLSRCTTAQETASIRGVVIDAVKHQPMRNVHVRLMLVNRGDTDNPAYGATSNEQGQFSISGLRTGTYFLQPLRAGYVHIPGSAPDAPGAPVVAVKAGSQMADIRLEMAPEVELSGRVTDEGGDPIPDVRVLAEAAGGRTYLGWHDSGLGITDDRGEFHIAMPPGKYLLKAEPDSGDSDVPEEIRSDGTSEAAYRAVFYPNTPEKARAAVLAVDGDRAGLDFRLASRAVLGIRGTISGIPQGCQVEVMLQTGSERGDVEFEQKATVDARGKFAIPHLDPGRYRLYAGCEVAGHALRSQMMELTLDNSVATADLALAPGQELTGTVEPAGAAGRTVRIESAFSTNGWGPSRTAPVAADGTFQITGIQPDRYRVLLLPQTANEYISVKLDDAGAPHNTVDLRQGGSKLKIAVAKGGAIAGAVIGGHANAMVFLFPDGDYSTDALRFHQTGGDPSFQFDALAPGKYRLYAWDPLAGHKWVEAQEAAAATDLVEVKAGELTKVNAKVIDARK